MMRIPNWRETAKNEENRKLHHNLDGQQLKFFYFQIYSITNGENIFVLQQAAALATKGKTATSRERSPNEFKMENEKDFVVLLLEVVRRSAPFAQ